MVEVGWGLGEDRLAVAVSDRRCGHGRRRWRGIAGCRVRTECDEALYTILFYLLFYYLLLGFVHNFK